MQRVQRVIFDLNLYISGDCESDIHDVQIIDFLIPLLLDDSIRGRQSVKPGVIIMRQIGNLDHSHQAKK